MKKEDKVFNKCPICGRPPHKESKYCIFHASAEEKTEKEFKNALKEYVNKIKKEDGDYDFRKFIFVGDIDFKKDLNITVFKNADFIGATFKGDVDLSWATFKGYAFLNNSTFEGYADFIRATFKGDAFLSNATFKGNAFLSNATFKGDAILSNATFKGDAILSYSKFLSNYNFEDARFEGDVLFENSIFSTSYDLILKVNGKGLVSFEHACIENIFLALDLDKEIQIDFTDSILRNTKIKKEQIENHILQEKENKYSEAKKIYLLLKNNFHTLGQYDDESWAFQKEKEMERKTYYFNAFTKNTESKEKKNKKKDQKMKKSKVILNSNWVKIKEFGKWIWSCFCNAIYGYGEKPLNVVISAGVIMIFFALLFSSIGISNPEIIDLKGITVDLNTGNIVDSASKGLLKNNIIKNFPDSLYFSLTTFTTLGYGDFRPLEGWGRILAGSEAFIGAFMMALFVYTFARRTGGK